MPGLNDDFALEDETPPVAEVVNSQSKTTTPISDAELDKVVFKDPTPGEVPEVKEDIGIISQAENKVQDLDGLRQDITVSGGMNTTFAMEAADIIPTFLGAERSIGYFTEQLSRTQYYATLESIDGEKKSWVVKVVEHLKAFAGQCVQWFKKFVQFILRRDPRKDQIMVFDSSDSKVSKPLSKLSDFVGNPEQQIAALKTLANSNFKDVDTKGFFEGLDHWVKSWRDQTLRLYDKINSGESGCKYLQLEPDVMQLCFTAVKNEQNMLQTFNLLYDFALKIGNNQMALPGLDVNTTGDLLTKRFESLVAEKFNFTLPGTQMTLGQAREKFKAALDGIGTEHKYVTDSTTLVQVIGKVSELFDVNHISKVIEEFEHASLGYDKFLKTIAARNDLQFSGIPAQVTLASKLLGLLAKEFNYQFVMRSSYSNVLHAYLDVGYAGTDLLNAYKKNVLTMVGGMDPKFQEFIKGYFGGGLPTFFTAD